jgi:DNA-binding response OmpR family regulator
MHMKLLLVEDETEIRGFLDHALTEAENRVEGGARLRLELPLAAARELAAEMVG